MTIMFFQRISSPLSYDELFERAVATQALFLNPQKVRSIQSLRLAFYLTQSAFKRNANTAKKFHLEFLLWLAERNDISVAVSEIGFLDPRDILFISFGRSKERSGLLREINATKKPLGIRHAAEQFELERISLSRL